LHFAGFLQHLRDLAIAYALSFFIDWNREHEGRSAGLRTFPLVAVASCGSSSPRTRRSVIHPKSGS